MDIKTDLMKRIQALFQQRVKQFIDIGGGFVHMEPDDPIDGATYDDPTLPKPRRPIVDDDLADWPVSWW